MGPSRAEVLDWIEGQLATRLSPSDQSNILRAAGCDGEDASGLMQAFARQFGVDLAGYQADMHHNANQSMAHIGWPIPLPKPHIPLSLTALHLAATTKSWPLTYPKSAPTPDHTWANLPLLILGLPALTLFLLWVLPHIF